jgi:predicted kinase
MPSARIVIISGPPGAGKSTIARALAEGSAQARAAHLHTDDFYAYIRKGFVAPWLPESQDQNIVVMKALARTAATYAQGGYEVLVDGVVGPWFFDPWLAAAHEHDIDLRYILLMPDEASTIARAVARQAPRAMTDPEVVRSMWRHFQTFASPLGNVLDTTGQGTDETVAQVRDGLDAGRFALHDPPAAPPKNS